MGSGLNAFHAMQIPGVPALSDRRFPGMSAAELGNEAFELGYRITPEGALALDRNYSPREQAMMNPPATREQNVAEAKRRGTFSDIRRKFNQENPSKRMTRSGTILDRVSGGMPRQLSYSETPLAGAGPEPAPVPKDISPEMRKQLNTGSFKGAFDAPRDRVAEEQERRQMLRDAAIGRSETRDASGRLSSISSKYGTGSVKWFKPGEAKPKSMTVDEFGKPESMSSFLERRKAVQQSKGMV